MLIWRHLLTLLRTKYVMIERCLGVDINYQA
jgi:hypothetical protein